MLQKELLANGHSYSMPYKMPQFDNSVLGCRRPWLSPMLTFGELTATFKDRVVTTQFECTRFDVHSMLVCVVSRYIV